MPSKEEEARAQARKEELAREAERIRREIQAALVTHRKKDGVNNG